jgi:hypothetical protein
MANPKNGQLQQAQGKPWTLNDNNALMLGSPIVTN